MWINYKKWTHYGDVLDSLGGILFAIVAVVIGIIFAIMTIVAIGGVLYYFPVIGSIVLGLIICFVVFARKQIIKNNKE